jgi:hypothetical protein
MVFAALSALIFSASSETLGPRSLPDAWAGPESPALSRSRKLISSESYPLPCMLARIVFSPCWQLPTGKASISAVSCEPTLGSTRPNIDQIRAASQWHRKTGRGLSFKTVLVSEPNKNSRIVECPYAPMTSKREFR